MIDFEQAQEKISALAKVLDELPSSDQGFAGSLLAQYHKKHGLSDKQWYWVDKLTKRAGQPDQAAPKIEGLEASTLYALFDVAGESLKKPKIRVQNAVAGSLMFYVSSKKSKVPDTINVTDGGAYGNSVWYGRITREGVWYLPLKGAPAAVCLEVQKLLADPVGYLSHMGKLNEVCCFCNSALTDERSTEAGYGPVCAKNYKLPWGQGKGLEAAIEDVEAAREMGWDAGDES